MPAPLPKPSFDYHDSARLTPTSHDVARYHSMSLLDDFCLCGIKVRLFIVITELLFRDNGPMVNLNEEYSLLKHKTSEQTSVFCSKKNGKGFNEKCYKIF